MLTHVVLGTNRSASKTNARMENLAEHLQSRVVAAHAYYLL